MYENESLAFRDSYAIPGTPERLWEALTNPAEIREWHLCEVQRFEPVVGGVVEYSASGKTVIKGRVTRVEPNCLLEHTFRFTAHANEPETLVTFRIEAHSTCSRMTLIHSGFPSINVTYRDICACWPMLICGLQEHLRQRHPFSRSSRAA